MESRWAVKGLWYFFLMGWFQNLPHVHVLGALDDLSPEHTHRLWTKGFHYQSLLVVVCPIHLKVLQSYPVFPQEPNNILHTIINTNTKYTKIQFDQIVLNMLSCTWVVIATPSLVQYTCWYTSTRSIATPLAFAYMMNKIHRILCLPCYIVFPFVHKH